jgi:hypothetical protein
MNSFLFQQILDCDAGTVTASIAGTLQDDGTASNLCTYEDFTAAVGGALVSAAAPASVLWAIPQSVPYRYIRLEIVAATGGGNTGDWTIFFRGCYA